MEHAGVSGLAFQWRQHREVAVHELSLCRAIAGIAKQHAQGRPVRRIGLRVGELRQVVPDTLVYCWSIVSEHHGLAGSVLDVESVPARITCRACTHSRPLTQPLLLCEECGSDDVTVDSGEEFLVTTLDLAEV
jgi:hydrogenase nickel incorporation protein HypA/HybF